MEKLFSFSNYMDQLARKHGVSHVFSDFLEMTVCALSLGQMEDRYFEIIKGYDKDELMVFSSALASIVIEMENDGEGLKDGFGDFFMEHISYGKAGQFFTPEHICEMMALITIGEIRDGERIADPCCGSGRTLLAAARINRNARFYGADIDRTCAMMCLVNMCLNGMFGEVACMDTLTNQFFSGWQVNPHPITGAPYIVPISEDQSYMVLQLPKHKDEQPKIKQQVLPVFDPVELSPISKQPIKQLLFDF
ncbi:MAG: N-6 DNA methylase [Prolixibacteraceae bacterium]|nr:N-6 DNA methylase [Prolixibacteraceae bacterium]